MSAIGQNGPAIGQIPDILNRLRAALAPWFPDPPQAPVLTSVLTAQADQFNFAYQYLQFAANQTRIATATGGWLDMIAWDFFGASFLRNAGEPDGPFRTRLLKEIFRPRQTRAALVQLLTDLSGVAPQLQEAWNPQDWGCYGNIPGSGCGYGLAIGYGSLAYPNQVFITTRQPGAGIPGVAGYGAANGVANGGGYGACGSLAEYADLSQIVGVLTPAQLYAQIARTVAAGVTAWVDIGTPPPVRGYPPPPMNYDWPNPRGPIGAIDLRTWIQQGNSRPPFGGIAPPIATNHDWPNPRGPIGAIDLRTWIQQGNSRPPFGGPSPPNATNHDWPNPRGALRCIDLLTWVQAGNAPVANIITRQALHTPIIPRLAPVPNLTMINAGGALPNTVPW